MEHAKVELVGKIWQEHKVVKGKTGNCITFEVAVEHPF